MAENGRRSSREQVLDELRAADKLIAVTHENPDGDALGSLVAMTHALRALGKDCHPFIDERELPLPREYDFLDTDGLLTVPPDDLDERTVVFLDCGNLERNAAEAFRHPGMRTVNIDHHHDNTMFGTVNLVDPRLLHSGDRLGSDARSWCGADDPDR
jgi:phosphoesterase RecJ-like protein